MISIFKNILYLLIILVIFNYNTTSSFFLIKINNDKIQDNKENNYFKNIINNISIKLDTNNIYINISNKKLYILNNFLPLNSNNFDISKKIAFKRIQSRPLSCEASAAADIISYFTNKNISEYEIYDIMKKDFDKTPLKKWEKLIWGNPNNGFVWNIWYYWKKKDIKPTQSWYTWYGVYEKPVKEVYDNFFIKTSIINDENHTNIFGPNEHLKLILQELSKWNMVQLWWDWCTNKEYEDGIIDSDNYNQEYADNNIPWKNECYNMKKNRILTWYYNDNWVFKKHQWLAWEHSFYLLWYEWNINNPKKIIIWDTFTWYHKYETKEWMRKWNLMNYRTIIAYHPNNDLVYNKKIIKKDLLN